MITIINCNMFDDHFCISYAKTNQLSWNFHEQALLKNTYPKSPKPSVLALNYNPHNQAEYTEMLNMSIINNMELVYKEHF